MPDRPIILASRSPRRAELLRAAGFRFEQLEPAFDDTGMELAMLPAPLAVATLAYTKAMSVRSSRPDALIIGCDTMLTLDDRRLGKAPDEAVARAMLLALMRRPHAAVTAAVVVDWRDGRAVTILDEARVEPQPLDAQVLERHLASGRWHGKAGAYNLAEIGSEWGWRVRDGDDPDTVVGLPMRRLVPLLRSMGAS
jgi:septum formation protein